MTTTAAVRRLPVERMYEPNIIHNPLTWFGVWTPQGWRVHRKRFGSAERVTVQLNGDGMTTLFAGALRDPQVGRVAWADDLHLRDDPFTDAGIYPADPRVEYPAGRARWAVSHSLLCYPVADHTLHTHEYTWDMARGDLSTCFRRHVIAEAARTDDRDGMTVTVRQRPVSGVIEGNIAYDLPNSAVRGVWSNDRKTGENWYARRVIQRVRMHNSVYGIMSESPILQCHGIWAVSEEEAASDAFDGSTGECADHARLIEQFAIPADAPKLGMLRPEYRRVHSRAYEGEVPMPTSHFGVIDEAHAHKARQRLGARFEARTAGYAADGATGQDAVGYAGYDPCFDLDDDGLISEQDIEQIARSVGRRVRLNFYLGGYFGNDWVSTGSGRLHVEHPAGLPAVVDYTYGGGYDPQSGVIRLLRSPGPGSTVWVEYYCDAPAEPGRGNIIAHLYRESQ